MSSKIEKNQKNIVSAGERGRARCLFIDKPEQLLADFVFALLYDLGTGSKRATAAFSKTC